MCGYTSYTEWRTPCQPSWASNRPHTPDETEVDRHAVDLLRQHLRHTTQLSIQRATERKVIRIFD
jgi:hypothetical protein